MQQGCAAGSCASPRRSALTPQTNARDHCHLSVLIPSARRGLVLDVSNIGFLDDRATAHHVGRCLGPGNVHPRVRLGELEVECNTAGVSGTGATEIEPPPHPHLFPEAGQRIATGSGMMAQGIPWPLTTTVSDISPSKGGESIFTALSFPHASRARGPFYSSGFTQPPPLLRNSESQNNIRFLEMSSSSQPPPHLNPVPALAPALGRSNLRLRSQVQVQVQVQLHPRVPLLPASPPPPTDSHG